METSKSRFISLTVASDKFGKKSKSSDSSLKPGKEKIYESLKPHFHFEQPSLNIAAPLKPIFHLAIDALVSGR
jgi:hypothetical protein